MYAHFVSKEKFFDSFITKRLFEMNIVIYHF